MYFAFVLSSVRTEFIRRECKVDDVTIHRDQQTTRARGTRSKALDEVSVNIVQDVVNLYVVQDFMLSAFRMGWALRCASTHPNHEREGPLSGI
jgi:hypothetical protein